MTYRQAIWGLSNGMVILALSGFFWLTLGLGLGLRLMTAVIEHPLLFLLLALLNPMFLVVLLVAASHVRRQAAGFRFADLREPDGAIAPDNRRVLRRLRFVLLLEIFAIAVGGLVCFYIRRSDLVMPVIALILGVHFVPLGWVFGVRAYFVTGIVSTAVALLALFWLDEPTRTFVLGYGMGVTAWLTGLYLIQNADRIARRLVSTTVL
jgi:Family of unknown function (DUF7010)